MKEITCTLCPNGCGLEVDEKDGKWIIKGNLCSMGKEFAIYEMTNPTRSVCTTVKTVFRELPRLPVKTDGEIPKKLVFDFMVEMKNVIVEKRVSVGDIIVKNVLSTGVNVVSTSKIE